MGIKVPTWVGFVLGSLVSLLILRRHIDRARMDRAPGGPYSMIAHGPTAPEA